MTSLVLGSVGAVVGGLTGGVMGAQIGWLVGSLIGNLIDPPKVEGPRRSDLKLQVSEYGKPIPRVFGTGRLAGNVIDQTDLQEHKETSGGKGGPRVTTYTYSASFAISLCVGPIVGIYRIWADGRLIWSQVSGEEMPCTLYLGTETQEPDPTFEAIHGVGEVPAYRGTAYVVFADYMLTDFGDRIPALEFEVFTEGGDIPWRVSTFDPWPDVSNSVTLTATYSDGRLTTYGWGSALLSPTIYVNHFSLDGTNTGSSSATMTGLRILAYVANAATYATVDGSGAAYFWALYNSNTETFSEGASYPGMQTNGTAGEGNPNVYQNGFIYSAAGTGTGGSPTTTVSLIGKHRATGGVPDGTFVATGDLDFSTAKSNIHLGTSNTGHIYAWATPIGSDVLLWKFDEDLNLIHRWTPAETAGTYFTASGIGNFHVYNDLICVNYTTGGLWYIGLVKINSDNTLSNYGVPLIHNNSGMTNLRGGLMIDVDGVFSLDPPPGSANLPDIISSLSDLTDVAAYDVSGVPDETVRWFAVANQMTVRNALDTLRKGFFFDAVESDDTVKFYKRGATDSVVTIDDDDLVARELGEESGDPLLTVRKKEKGLPRTVSLRYIDVDADYQAGVQNSPRLTTLSDSDVTLDLAIGFTANEALQKCWSLQVAEWIERETFEWQTTREYAWVEPCDVVTVRGRVIRITNRTETPSGVLRWEGVLHRPSIYTQEQTAPISEGFTEQPDPSPPVATELVLLDIPILSQHDSPFGFYAAMGPSRDGRWPGAALYKSLDGGLNYFLVASANVPSIIGATASSDTHGSPPGSPTVSGVLSSYSGGDTVEEASICVVLTDDDAELASCTATALTNGANLCAISRGTSGSPATLQWELLQFRDAELIAANTYILSGFKRGRKNTSTSGHASGDTFVLLPVTNVDAPEAEIGLTLQYKAVTFGLALADTTSQDFTNTGLSRDSFYDTEGDNLPIYGEAPGSPTVLGPGLVPPPSGSGCDPDYFLNQCGTWAIPAGAGGAGSPSAGGSIEVQDEGATLTSAASIVDFVGLGVTATYAGGKVTVTIPGGVSVGSPSIAGTYGSSTLIPIVTVNDYGIITNISTTTAPNVAGSDSQVQYNNGGVFGGDSRFTFDDTNKVALGQFSVDAGGINAQTGTSYALVASDNGKVVTLSNASAITLSVPSGLCMGFSCIIVQIGAGQVTVASGSGSPTTTINSYAGLKKLAGQHAAASIVAYAPDTFNLVGTLSS